MEVRGVCFGKQLGGKALFGSPATDIVELCFEDHELKKGEYEVLYVTVVQYEDAEDIRVSELPLFGAFMDPDMGHDEDYIDDNTFEQYGNIFSDDYHEKIKGIIAVSTFAREITLTRHAMDLFKKEKYETIGGLYGVEADDFNAPDVGYDKKA